MNPQHESIVCKGFWQSPHLPVVLRGPLAIPFRIVGLRPSRMNPNTCTFCELAFTRIQQSLPGNFGYRSRIN
jgi:adenylate cyclase